MPFEFAPVTCIHCMDQYILKPILVLLCKWHTLESTKNVLFHITRAKAPWVSLQERDGVINVPGSGPAKPVYLLQKFERIHEVPSVVERLNGLRPPTAGVG